MVGKIRKCISSKSKWKKKKRNRQQFVSTLCKWKYLCLITTRWFKFYLRKKKCDSFSRYFSHYHATHTNNRINYQRGRDSWNFFHQGVKKLQDNLIRTTLRKDFETFAIFSTRLTLPYAIFIIRCSSSYTYYT